MKRRLFLTLFAVLTQFAALPLLAAEPDAVVMRIGDRAVGQADFERAYRSNDLHLTLSPEEFVQRYAASAVKAMEAERLGLDTLPTFRAQMVNLPMPQVAAQGEEGSGDSSQCWVHLFVYLPQNGTPQQLGRLRALADSLHRDAQQYGGLAKFLAVYPPHSHPYVMAECLTSLPKHRTITSIEQTMAALSMGQLSELLITEAGAHLFQLLPTEAVSLFSAASDPSESLRQAWREALLQQAWEEYVERTEVDPQALGEHLKRTFGSKREVRQWMKHAPLSAWKSAWQNYLLTQCFARYSVEFNESIIKSVNSR